LSVPVDRPDRELLDLLAAAMEAADTPIVIATADRTIVWVNRALERLTGYSSPEVVGKPASAFWCDLQPAFFYDDIWATLLSGKEWRGDLMSQRKDGSRYDEERAMTPIRDAGGRITHVISIQADVTERKLAERKAKETHDRLNIELRHAGRQSREAAKLSELVDVLQACQTLPEAYEVTASTLKTTLPYRAGAICITSPTHNVVEVMASWGNSQVGEKAFRPDECWALRRSRVHCVKDPSSPLRCAHMRGVPDGGYFCVPLAAQGESFGVLCLESPPEQAATFSDDLPRERRSDSVDIEARQASALGERLSLTFGNLRLREALRTQSIRDPLTNLYNRRYMEESLEREISRSTRSGQSVAVLLMDIDHFKLFNDTHGHQGGDALLRALGDFLSQRTRSQDVACRYGGEEFAIILSGTNAEKASQRAQLFREDLKHMTVEHSGQIAGQITMSIGIAVAPENGTTGAELIRAADVSLYRAKADGRDRVVVA
jgi:diguanylate cyclase (GGDEF)-like protein/PAS domain S-box-containing protein